MNQGSKRQTTEAGN